MYWTCSELKRQDCAPLEITANFWRLSRESCLPTSPRCYLWGQSMDEMVILCDWCQSLRCGMAWGVQYQVQMSWRIVHRSAILPYDLLWTAGTFITFVGGPWFQHRATVTSVLLWLFSLFNMNYCQNMNYSVYYINRAFVLGADSCVFSY